MLRPGTHSRKALIVVPPYLARTKEEKNARYAPERDKERRTVRAMICDGVFCELQRRKKVRTKMPQQSDCNGGETGVDFLSAGFIIDVYHFFSPAFERIYAPNYSTFMYEI